MKSTVRIDERFCGPPDSGNGGYVCGCLAKHMGGATTAVRLRVPPPLATALDVCDSEAGIALFDGDVIVAEARSAELPFASSSRQFVHRTGPR